MKARRLISVGLSAALLMGLTACTDEEPAVGGNEPSAPSPSQAVPATTSGVPSTMKEDDKEAMAGIEVKDAKKLENPTVKWLSFWDINPVKDSFNNGASWTQTRESIIPAVQAELDTVNARLNS